MLKKFLFFVLIALLTLSLLPTQAKACESNAVKAGSLIKASSNSVYYYGADGKRYIFPNEKTYKTWFVDFSMIITISDQLLGEVPIGGNVTYKPGARLVKITTDPKVYWVDKTGTLRHLASESIAKQLFGNNWHSLVDDVPDPFFVNYKIGLPIETPSLPTIEVNYSINQDKLLTTTPDPTSSELGTIELNGSVIENKAKLNWKVKNFYAEKGFKVVMSNQPDPVYPGNDFHYLSDPNVRSDVWENIAPGTYYFRVCEYLDGKCGVYSNNLVLKVADDTPYQTDKKINLEVYPMDGAAKLIWSSNFYSTKGFKLVKSSEPNPIYPGNDYKYLSDPNTTKYIWSGLAAGKTLHFRVCEYLGGSCGTYSNDAAVTIEGTATDNSNGSINLTGWYDSSANKVRLEWAVNDMYSSKGFKVVKSLEPNPVYPGNDYHYLSDPNTRNDKWYGLAPGTYHFRVCEYLGGACGIYSDDIIVTVQ